MGNAGRSQGMDVGPGGRRTPGVQDEAVAVRQQDRLVREKRTGQGEVRGTGCDGEEAEGGPDVPRRDGAEVVVAGLVGRRVRIFGVGDGTDDVLGLRGSAEVVELPRSPFAWFVARPVVGSIAGCVELREERRELGGRRMVAAHQRGETGEVLRDGPGVLDRVALFEAGLAARFEL